MYIDSIKICFGNLPINLDKREFGNFVTKNSRLFKFVDKRVLLYRPIFTDEQTLFILLSDDMYRVENNLLQTKLKISDFLTSYFQRDT